MSYRACILLYHCSVCWFITNALLHIPSLSVVHVGVSGVSVVSSYWYTGCVSGIQNTCIPLRPGWYGLIRIYDMSACQHCLYLFAHLYFYILFAHGVCLFVDTLSCIMIPATWSCGIIQYHVVSCSVPWYTQLYWLLERPALSLFVHLYFLCLCAVSCVCIVVHCL